MLSIATVKGAASTKMAEYYTKEYAEGVGEMSQSAEMAAERTRWWGDGAAARGLEGSVDQEDLQAILQGRDHETGQLLYDPGQVQMTKLAKNLGIERELGSEADYQALRAGLNPETGQPLPRVAAQYVENLYSGRKGMDRSVSAVDLTLSAPKSVSLMVAVGDEELQRVAAEAHEKAVDAAMTFVKEELVAVRRGDGGTTQEAADHVTAALITQLASRQHDPQLHTHCVLSTAARAADGRVSALNAALLHRASKVIGSVYQQELRHQMSEELGVSWDVHTNGLGEIREVPDAVLKEFSKRTRDIDASITAQHEDNQRLIRDVELRLDVYERAELRVRQDPENASQEDLDRAKKLDQYHMLLRSGYQEGKMNLSRQRLLQQLTRPSKDEPAEHELREQWKEQWERSGMSWGSVLERSRSTRYDEVKDYTYSEDVVADFRTRLEDALVTQSATFGKKEAIIAGLRVADPRWDSERTVAEVEQYLDDKAVVVQEDTTKYANWALGHGGKYTTETVLQQEKDLKEMAGRMLDRDDSAVCDLQTTAQKAAEYTLNDEQEELLTSLCVSGQQLVMARGIAGSGKTHVLGSAASVLRSDGYQVVGLATAAATAQRLSSESGFDRSSSIDRFLQLAQNGKWERGTSTALLRQREMLQSEQRELNAKYAELESACGDDAVQLDAVAEERAAALAEWQKRWDDWLKAAGEEQTTREEIGAALESRRVTLDNLAQELELREEAAQGLPKDAYVSVMAEIRREQSQLHEARERLGRDTEDYRKNLAPAEDLPTDDKVVIVVDEAGMVETDHYHRLLSLAEERNWKIAFVGDDRQLQEVNRGGAFRMLAEMGGSVELGTARRARTAWERDAQRQWWASEDPNSIKEVADAYIENDRVTFVTERVVRTAIAAENMDPDQVDPKEVEREVARKLMVERFFEDYDKGVEHLLIAATREDVHSLNKAVQEEMIKRGVVKADGDIAKAADIRGKNVAGWYDLHEGDSVMIMHNISGTPVKNGMTGSVTKVRSDGGVEAELPTGPDGVMRKHNLTKEHLDEGYVALGNAVTAHKSQGMSVEAATALGDSKSQRLMLYPAMTRGKGQNNIVWLVDKDGPEPEQQLADAMTRSDRKLTALESWSKEPTPAEIQDVQERMARNGVELTDEEAHARVMENRRLEYLQTKEEAERRNARMAQSHEMLTEKKQTQVLQHEKVKEIRH